VRTVQNGTAAAYVTNSADQYVQVGAATSTYDADGNLLARTNGAAHWTYAYDDQNQLIAVSGPGGTWTYEYDVLGNRVAATHDGERTEYLVDPAGFGDVVGTYDGAGTLTARYLHGAGLTGRVDASGQVSYFAFDALGNTSEITDASGAVLNQYAYQPFGERLAGQESIENPFQFVGEHGVMHEGHDLLFMRARYYDPQTGRFTQRDPVGSVQGPNLYDYASGDPLNRLDPSGTFWGAELFWASTKFMGTLGPLSDEALRALIYSGHAADKFRQFEVIWRPFHQAMRSASLRHFPAEFGKYILNGVRAAPQVVSSAARTAVTGIGEFIQSIEVTGVPSLAEIGEALSQAAAQAGAWVSGTASTAVATLGTDVAALSGGTVLVAGAIAGAAGYAVGTAIRYIPGVDEAAQSAWSSLNDWTGGWLFGIPPTAELGSRVVTSHDPNDLIGPAGTGFAHWVGPDQTLPYTVRFENDKQATAPAQVVRITEQLDPDLDLTTFQLGNFSFDGVVVTVPAGRTFYSERLDLRTTYGLYLDISANLDFETGIVTWVFASVDPVTGSTPRDPLTGFLPPNVTSPIGEGYVTYTIRPQSSSGIGTPISAEARIVFDTNDPIDTPHVRNPVGPIADCTGDCNNGGQVTVDELLTMVNIALGNLQVQACAAGDQNADGTVTIDEILTAVNHALNGCSTGPASVQAHHVERAPSRAVRATPTPTATATPTPSATPTESRPLM
jgi:RHS repeat-associated protein